MTLTARVDAVVDAAKDRLQQDMPNAVEKIQSGSDPWAVMEVLLRAVVRSVYDDLQSGPPVAPTGGGPCTW
jgi:hypothetical protein